MKKLFKYLFATSLTLSCSHTSQYPHHWWEKVDPQGAPAWEILPQKARAHEVIVSKRNELGLLSNFAPTSFVYEEESYASVEGFWQMMKYPEDKDDPRSKEIFPFTRQQVAQMSGLEAKAAGDKAELIMKKLGIDWVTYKGKKMQYCSKQPDDHYRLIKNVMWEKLRQNPRVEEVLLKTGNLILRPDHYEEDCPAPEWKYYQMWMEIRASLKKSAP